MKRNFLTVSLIMLTLFIQPIQANDMLMDPMPAANPAPDFNLMGMDGETHTLEDLKGKFVLVNFWATWCNPCKVEMPLLEKLHQTLKSDKFTVLGLHVGQRVLVGVGIGLHRYVADVFLADSVCLSICLGSARKERRKGEIIT